MSKITIIFLFFTLLCSCKNTNNNKVVEVPVVLNDSANSSSNDTLYSSDTDKKVIAFSLYQPCNLLLFHSQSSNRLVLENATILHLNNNLGEIGYVEENYESKLRGQTFPETYFNNSVIDSLMSIYSCDNKDNIYDELLIIENEEGFINAVNRATYTFPKSFLQTPELLNNKGYFLQKHGYNEEAIILLALVIKKFPKRIVAYLNIADAYWALNQHDEAKVNYKQYVNLMTLGKQDLTKIPQYVSDRLK